MPMPDAATPVRRPFTQCSSPLWRALTAQATGLIAATAAGASWSLLTGAAISTMPWIFVQCVSAGVTAAALRLQWWWIAVSLVFVPALAIGVAVSLPALWPGAALLALLLTYGGTQGTRVPLYLSSRAAVRALRELLPTDRPISLLDIGAGTGTVLAAIGCSHSNVAAQGVERAPMPFLLAFLRAWVGGRRYRVRWGNLWSTDLSSHDIVYAYLSPVPMPRLWEKAKREMRPGSLLISYRFLIPGVVPDRMIDAGKDGLYVWRLP